jgi:S-formylglutathione hydrolase
MPDTSPRGDNVPSDPQGQWDFGHGAGFYVDAEKQPWSLHYKMHSFVVEELITQLCTEVPLDDQRLGISGHSMGGHGALVLGLRHPHLYRSVSAVAPIAHPGQCSWGQKAFGHLLGTTPEERLTWRQWDAVTLLEDGHLRDDCLLVDIGSADPFLEEQLRPEDLRNACFRSGQSLEMLIHEGYDHSYFFVASVIDRHLAHHAKALKTEGE